MRQDLEIATEEVKALTFERDETIILLDKAKQEVRVARRTSEFNHAGLIEANKECDELRARAETAEAECKRLMLVALNHSSVCEKYSNEREWAEEAQRG
jgi:hypothetical protein